MAPNIGSLTTSVCFIDGNDADRAYSAEGLESGSSEYLILEAPDGESGLDLYRRSRQIDRVVLELSLPDQSGHENRRGAPSDTMRGGAVGAAGDRGRSDLDISIQRAMAYVEWMPTEDRYRPL